MSFVGGSLSGYYDQWVKTTVNPVVLDWIRNGVPIFFTQVPGAFESSNPVFSNKQKEFLSVEIPNLINSNCVEKCLYKPTCVSPISTVPKANGQLRLITDLRRINEHCVKKGFVNENINQVLDIVAHKEHLITIDIKNGFFHVTVAPEFRKFLGFKWEGNYYVWKVLPFGLSLSPYFFCKILRPVVQILRESNVKTVCYVDDFIVADSAENIENSKATILDILKGLGFFVNFKKSVLIPSTTVRYIGYIIDTDKQDRAVLLSIPKDRIKKVKKDIKRALGKGKLTARALARISGQLISMSKVFLPAKLLLRNIYRLLSTKSTWQDTLVLDNPSIGDLNWWLAALQGWNGRYFKQTADQLLQLTTDASGSGYGGTIIGHTHRVQGFWDSQTKQLSSNAKELLAVLLTLKSSVHLVRNKTIQVLSDSVTTVAYINFQGGSNKVLDSIAKNIWDLTIRNSIKIQAKHLAGSRNVEADALSRLSPQYEWFIHPSLFNYLDTLFGPHTIDRFASILTNQVPRYNSLYLDPGTEGVDALHQTNWQLENNYVNAPFRLLPKIIAHIANTQSEATIIAPWWPSKTWFNQLKQMSVCAPLKLPRSRLICIPLQNVVPEPLKNKRWRLFAWRVNGSYA